MLYNYGTYGFVTFDDIPLIPFELKDLGIERRITTDYYFDNRNRDISGYLFQYTLKGYGMIEIENTAYKVEPGQGFFVEIPGNEKYYMHGNGGEWEYLYLHMEGSAVKNYYDKIIQRTGKILTLADNCSAVQYLLQLHEQLSNGYKLPPFVGSEIIFHFLCLLCRTVAYNQEKYSFRTRRAMERMEQDYHTLDGISQLVEEFNVTPSHFTREFTKETGMTPLRYLTNIRIQHSMELLSNTTLSINEVALQCGFSCGNYFSKLFKKYTKISPNQFRNK